MQQCVVLENIRSAYNVGNIIRTADALGYQVVLSGYTPGQEHAKVAKTALGAQDHVAIRQFWNTKKALSTLRDEGYLLVAAEKTATSLSLNKADCPTDRTVALIVGNEKEGFLAETDLVVHIPMRGYKESLNVGQAAAICMWRLQRAA